MAFQSQHRNAWAARFAAVALVLAPAAAVAQSLAEREERVDEAVGWPGTDPYAFYVYNRNHEPDVASARAEMLRACAAEELRLRTLIDDLGETGEASTCQMQVASFLFWQGRAACLRGQLARGLEAFAAIDLPPATLSILEDRRAAAALAGEDAPRRRAAATDRRLPRSIAND
jgi:hypothetical protein